MDVNLGKKKGGILCPHCFTKNPTKAYCCLKCFKVIHGGGKASLLKTHFQKNRLFLLSGILICLCSALLIQKWLRGVESHMTNIHDQNQQYYESMTRYKKKITQIKSDQISDESELVTEDDLPLEGESL